VFSRASLVAHDRATAEKTGWIRDHASAESIVLASAEVLVASYYLPGQAVRYSNHAATTTYDLVVDRPTTIIVYEPAARPEGLTITQRVEFTDGGRLELATVSSGTLRLGGADIGDARR